MNRNLSSEQFGMEHVTGAVDGYDPEQVGPHAKARFSLEHLDLSKVEHLQPANGEQHDKGSSINDGYYSSMEGAVPHNVPPVIATQHPDGHVELHDGWHRASIALAKGITTLPAYVHRPSR